MVDADKRRKDALLADKRRATSAVSTARPGTGHHDRLFGTRLGSLQLRIPKLSQDSYIIGTFWLTMTLLYLND